MARPDADTAYFTLLRAREDETRLQRYREWLADERRRMVRLQSERAAHEEPIDARLRRPLRAVDTKLNEAVQGRVRVIDEELAATEQRILDAAEYVRDCEAAHAELS